MSKIYNLFPTTVFESNIGVNKKEKNFLLNENYDVVKQNDTKNGLTSLDKHILDNTKYSSLKQKILKETNNYLFNIFQINKTINFYRSKKKLYTSSTRVWSWTWRGKKHNQSSKFRL